MASEWHEEPLSKLCTYIGRGSAPAYVDQGGILVLNQKCVRNQMVTFQEARRTDTTRKPVAPERMLQRFDILVNSTGVGTLGRVAQIHVLPEEATVDSHVTVLRPDALVIDPYYLGFVVRHTEAEIEALGEGSTGQTELSRERLRDFRVLVAPCDLQPKIAHILGTLDDKIELNRRMNETLETMARAVFKSWFVDFDPVRAKDSGEAPESICRRLGLTLDLLALFPDRLVDSALGEIPEGWEAKPFGDWLAHMIGGDWGADQPEEQFPVEVRIIRGTDIPKLKCGMGEEVPRRFVQANKFESRKLQPEDLILEVSGGSKGQPTGRGLRVTERILEGLGGSVVPASFCRLLRPKSPDMGALLGLHLDLIYEAGKTWEYQNQSTGISNFQTKYFLERELVVDPGEKVRGAFSQLVAPLLSGQYLKEAGMLAVIRDALLPKLLSGELPVPVAENVA